MKVVVFVKPGSKKGNLIAENTDKSLTVYTTTRPIQGQANLATIKLLAQYFGVSENKISLIKGLKNKNKVFFIDKKDISK